MEKIWRSLGMSAIIFLFTLFFFLPSVGASHSEASIITNGFQVDPLTLKGAGNFFFRKQMQVEYKGGRMFISRNPDGTGSAYVGDEFVLLINYVGSPGFPIFTYDSHDRLCRTHTPLPPTDLGLYFGRPGLYNVIVLFKQRCWAPSNVDSLYFVNLDIPHAPPQGPPPFLDLPWDYEARGLKFGEAALLMSSFFDHEYPLLSFGLSEPQGARDTIIRYDGPERTKDNYSSHDGYDYARRAKALDGDAVLAASGGWASYVNSCTACGNMILIDHQNGFQSRYLHLQKDDLVIATTEGNVRVGARAPIGKVGATGNTNGAHIHFMLVQDKNKDGDFNDNIPDGLVDPYGWKSTEEDPWESYSFKYKSTDRTGNRSYYLFTKPLDEISTTLSPTTEKQVNVGRYTILFPADTYNQDVQLTIEAAPPVEISETTTSVGPSLIIIAKDLLGNLISLFQKLFTIEIDLNGYDFTPYKTETLSIYSSSDGITWTKEQTTVDLIHNKATTQVDHLTQFALIAQRKDATAPITTAQIIGTQGEEHWYRSDVQLALTPQDNEGGLGVDYTLYKIEGHDWETYTTPLTFTHEGPYTMEYYSVDKDDNKETIKTIEFDIDKTPPEAQLSFDIKSRDIVFKGNDTSATTLTRTQRDQRREEIVLADQAGNTLSLVVKDKEKDKKSDKHHEALSLESLTYNQENPVMLTQNRFLVFAAFDHKNNLRELLQMFKVHEEMSIKLEYNAKTDVTTIIKKEKGKEKQKEQAGGMKLLQLTTENGRLKAAY